MSVTILRPPPVLGAVEAMRLRDTFELMVEVCGAGVIVDLTGVQELSAAGLAAVTNFLSQGRRIGTPIRVLLPEAGTEAARVIDQADLRRFLAPRGMWNTLPSETGPGEPVTSLRVQRPWLLRRLGRGPRQGPGAPRALLTPEVTTTSDPLLVRC